MNPIHSLLACAVLLPSLARAEDFTVEEKPFTLETTLQGTFLPAQSQAVRITPKVWTDFPITSLVPQGATVKKGDTLIGIDSEKLDLQIAQIEQNRASAELALAQAKHELAQLEINTPRQLEDAARAEKEATENLKWYTEIGHPKEIEEAHFSVKKSEQNLAYIEEELKQLLIMYKEDDKIEETEEIILIRTRNSVEATKLAVKFTKIASEKALNTSIPRKLLGLQLAHKKAQTANTAAKEKLPRELELKRLAVAKAIRDDAKATERLAKLKADRSMMNIQASTDGVVYYGSIENGRWSPETAAKILRVGGKLPAQSIVMTLIPAGSPLVLSAFTEAANLPALQGNDIQGHATTSLSRFQTIPVKLSHLADYPETNGSFRVTLQPQVPESLKLVPGMKATANIISHSVDKALKIPAAYITSANDGTHTVQLKLADGKTAPRQVTVGPANQDWVVITKGLDIGQVIVK